MSLREIPVDDWETFLHDFSRGHRAWLATVERISGRASHVEAVDRPLSSVTPDVTARRIVGIDIEFQPDARASSPVHVNGPVKLRVDVAATGSARALEIEDERGDCTRIRFRAAPSLEALDGVVPGEL